MRGRDHRSHRGRDVRSSGIVSDRVPRWAVLGGDDLHGLAGDVQRALLDHPAPMQRHDERRLLSAGLQHIACEP